MKQQEVIIYLCCVLLGMSIRSCERDWSIERKIDVITRELHINETLNEPEND